MKAKSIFSKIVAGVGALAMVATMLPALAAPAQAADLIHVYFEDGNPLTTHASIREYPGDVKDLAKPHLLTEVTPNNPGTAVAIGATVTDPKTWTVEAGKQYVVVPDAYYEYTSAPQLTTASAGVTMTNVSAVTESPTSYIVTFNGPNNSIARLSHPDDVVVTVNVIVGEGVRAHDRTVNPNGRRSEISGTRSYSIKRVLVDSNGNAIVDGNAQAATDFTAGNLIPTYEVEDTSILAKHGSAGATATWPGDYEFEDGANQGTGGTVEKTNRISQGSPIIIYAEKQTGTAGDFTMFVENLDVEGNGPNVSYSSSVLTDLVTDDPAPGAAPYLAAWPDDFGKYQGNLLAKTGFGGSGVTDLTSYIGLYKLNNQLLDGSNLHGTSAAIDAKSKLPSAITSNIEFGINPEDIYRLYALGISNGDDSKMPKDNDATAGTADDWSDNRTAGIRYGAYKTINIYLGATLRKDIGVKIENGKEITNDMSVANKYRFEYVIRDKNGNRFDAQEDVVQNYLDDVVLSADPYEWPSDRTDDTPAAITDKQLQGSNRLSTTPGVPAVDEKYNNKYTEGDTFEFKILVDPLFKKNNKWDPEKDVVVMAYDNDPSKRIARSIVKYDKDTDTYSFTVGKEGPYRVVVLRNIGEQDTGIVRNIPQSDAIFDTSHRESASLLNTFYGYERFKEADMGTCNVANPRYQLFISANEEDDTYIDLMSFATRGAVGSGVDYNGHSYPIGEHKFKIRFSDEFVSVNDMRQGTPIVNPVTGAVTGWRHGIFDNDVTNDRYAPGPDFKVTANDTTLTPDADGNYTFTVEKDKKTDIKVDGLVRAYYVYAPNVAAYDIEPNYPAQRERNDGDTATNLGNNFRSSVPEGANYSFKLKLAEGTQKGPDFKVMLVAAGDKEDNANNFIPTEIKEGADGSYSFEVKNDVQIVVYGLTGTGFLDTSNLDGESQLAIDWLLSNGMTEGDGEGHFMPNANTRRGDFVLMLYRYYGEPASSGTGNFSDVAADAYYAKAVAWGTGKGIINGYPDGTFRPMNIISRAEVANILSKLCGLGSVGNNPFTDVNAGDWFYAPVMRCYAAGIVNGTSATTFTPNAGIIREHYALMLYRARAALPAK